MGTLEEVFEILVGRLLGYHRKPVVILNVAGFYDPLLAMLENGIRQGFIKARARDAWSVAAKVTEAIESLRLGPAGELAANRRPEPDRLGCGIE